MPQTKTDDLYPSRVANHPSITERKDPIVHAPLINRSGQLTKEQIVSYEKNGFLLLQNLFTENELKNLQNHLKRIWHEKEQSDSLEVIREPESDEIRSIFAIHQSDEVFNQLSREPRIIDAARQVLNSDVYIHQSRINFKPGFTGKEFYWHSDFETWHVEDGMPRMRAVSFSILLDDNLPFNGSLMLIPGSHKYYISCVGKTPENHFKESLKKQRFGVPDEQSLTWLVDKLGLQMPTAKAGSVLMFECNTMHGSNSNITPFPRRNVFMVYNSVQNALVDPFSGGQPRPEFIASHKPELIVL